MSALIRQAQLDLHADDFDVTYIEAKKRRKIGQKSDFIETARISIKPEYLKAQMEFAPQARKDFRTDFDEFRRTLYHEIAHIIIDPLYLDQQGELSPIERHYFNQLRECATEKVGRIGRWKREIRDELDALKKEKKKSKRDD